MSGFDLNSMFSEETLKNKTKNVHVLEVNLSDIENNVANFYPIESTLGKVNRGLKKWNVMTDREKIIFATKYIQYIQVD